MSLTPEQQKYEADMIAHHTPEELVRKLSEAKRQIDELQSRIDGQQEQQPEQQSDSLVNDQHENNNQIQPGPTPHTDDSAPSTNAGEHDVWQDEGELEPVDTDEGDVTEPATKKKKKR